MTLNGVYTSTKANEHLQFAMYLFSLTFTRWRVRHGRYPKWLPAGHFEHNQPPNLVGSSITVVHNPTRCQ